LGGRGWGQGATAAVLCACAARPRAAARGCAWSQQGRRWRGQLQLCPPHPHVPSFLPSPLRLPPKDAVHVGGPDQVPHRLPRPQRRGRGRGRAALAVLCCLVQPLPGPQGAAPHRPRAGRRGGQGGVAALRPSAATVRLGRCLQQPSWHPSPRRALGSGAHAFPTRPPRPPARPPAHPPTHPRPTPRTRRRRPAAAGAVAVRRRGRARAAQGGDPRRRPGDLPGERDPLRPGVPGGREGAAGRGGPRGGKAARGGPAKRPPPCAAGNPARPTPKSPSPKILDKDFVLPIGKAKVMRAGSHVTITAHSKMVGYSLQAAEKLAQEGIEAEVRGARAPAGWGGSCACPPPASPLPEPLAPAGALGTLPPPPRPPLLLAGHQPAQPQATRPPRHRGQRAQDAPPGQRGGGLADVRHRQRDLRSGDGGLLR
jgi:hypothetical protein